MAKLGGLELQYYLKENLFRLRTPVRARKKLILAVVIGRNEGERLRECLHSVTNQIACTVYVDSASLDSSCEIAESFNIDVVRLDDKSPLSAARARNVGFDFLKEKYQDIGYVHFIDGDCILLDGWVERALPYMHDNDDLAIITGRLHERYPEKSIYNTLCDIEWDTPTGEVQSSGGIFIVDKKAFEDVGGFNSDMACGEEPDLCLRLIKKEWRVYKADIPMALHDSNITTFTQWWKRSMRSGYAFALGAFCPAANLRYIKSSLSVWFWALFYPGIVFYISSVISFWFVTGLLLYFYQFAKLLFCSKRKGLGRKRSLLHSVFLILIKWPQMLGQAQYFYKKAFAR